MSPVAGCENVGCGNLIQCNTTVLGSSDDEMESFHSCIVGKSSVNGLIVRDSGLLSSLSIFLTWTTFELPSCYSFSMNGMWNSDYLTWVAH